MLRRLFGVTKRAEPLVVGIGGVSRSGKTTLANALLGLLPRETTHIIHLDRYFSLDAIMQRQAETHTPFQNWEEPHALDLAAFSADLTKLVATAAAQTRSSSPRPIVIAEGFLLFAEPLVRRFDRSVFLWCDEATAKRRRFETKRVPEGYFEAMIWPYHLQHNKHLPGWKETGEPLGDILVLDGTREATEQMARKTL
jgi:uridine kinase